MSGRVGDLSPEQEEALQNLWKKIEDVKSDRCDDRYLLRFLRARNFDLEKATDKIRTTLEFRKKWGADHILNGDYQPPEALRDYFPTGALPEGDKTDGRPIVVGAIGKADPKGILKSCSWEELVKFKVYRMEILEQRMKTHSEKYGKVVDTANVILDMEGLNSSQLTRPAIKLMGEFMKIEEMHYPEIVNKIFVIRAPRIFPTAYALVKPLIDPRTREKIDVLGGNWKEKVQEWTTPDNLPEFYGGNLKEVTTVCWGGKIPLHLYKENDDSLLHQYVKPGKEFVVEVEVKKKGVQLTWEFVTEDHDIGFSVVLGGKILQPYERIQAHLGTVVGSLTCEEVGTYLMKWDNSFSWTRGKNLKYKHEIMDPEDPLEEGSS